MQQLIVDFEIDDEGHWRAKLACGHDQHTRHTPPLRNREWVLTPEGRRSNIGVRIECLRCDGTKKSTRDSTNAT